MAVSGNRDRVLYELRLRGRRGILWMELRRLGIPGVGAHVESLRFDGYVIEQVDAPGLDGSRDTRFTLLAAPAATTPETTPAAPEKERPVQALLGTAPARPETSHEGTP